MRLDAALARILGSTVALALFAAVGTALVAFTYEATAERIRLNQREALLRSLHAVIAPGSHDNDLFNDHLELWVPELQDGNRPVVAYRARRQGRPVAAALVVAAPDGYNGTIRLLVGVRYDGTLTGVRVLEHHETPGLGDAIDEERSDWILQFAGLSLDNPPLNRWKVKRDGGVFDQFTGATITPRAVVKAIRKTLIYYREHRDLVFSGAPAAAGGEQDHG